jgi:hypothetical protein
MTTPIERTESPVERLQRVVQDANRRWTELPEDERRTKRRPAPIPVPEPLAVLCEQYAKTATILHDEALSAGQSGFAHLSKLATERPRSSTTSSASPVPEK